MAHVNDNCESGAPSTPKQRGRKPVYAEWPSDGLSATDKNGTQVLITREMYFRALNDSKLGDQPPLRKLWTLAERQKVHITELPRTAPNLARLLAKHKLHPVPERYARQILICLVRLVERVGTFSALAFEPPEDQIIHTLPPARVPEAFTADLRRWLGMTPVSIDGQPNPANALAAETIQTYLEDAAIILAATAGSGVELDPTVDIAFLVQKGAVGRWKPHIEARCERSTLVGRMAGILRIAEDLKCAPEDIASLKVKMGTLAKLEIGLSAEEKDRIASWIEPEKHRCLLSAPGELVGMADDVTAGRASRILTGAAGLALQLMYEHPSLDEAWIAHCDFLVHLREVHGRLCVIGPVVPEPVSPELAALVARVREQRRQMGIPNTLLLPGKDGLPREVRAAMEAIYNCLQSILGDRLKCSDLRDINTSMAEDAQDTDTAETAAGAGYQHTRSLQRRLGRVAAPSRRRRGRS